MEDSQIHYTSKSKVSHIQAQQQCGYIQEENIEKCNLIYMGEHKMQISNHLSKSV